MNSKKKGFTLIETIIALGILTLIAVILLPSLQSIKKSQYKLKDNTRIIYALEEAIETKKVELNSSEVNLGTEVKNCSGLDILVETTPYNTRLIRIKASHNSYELEVIEVAR